MGKKKRRKEKEKEKRKKNLKLKRQENNYLHDEVLEEIRSKQAVALEVEYSFPYHFIPCYTENFERILLERNGMVRWQWWARGASECKLSEPKRNLVF